MHNQIEAARYGYRQQKIDRTARGKVYKTYQLRRILVFLFSFWGDVINVVLLRLNRVVFTGVSVQASSEKHTLPQKMVDSQFPLIMDSVQTGVFP